MKNRINQIIIFLTGLFMFLVSGCYLPPDNLLIYYGYPNAINKADQNTADPIGTAAAEFAKYSYVVLGGGIEETPPLYPLHGAHNTTVEIIKHKNSLIGTMYIGYIDLGVTTKNYSMAEIKNRVDLWKATGVRGIFFDDFGYDFNVTRERQNEAVSYVHSQGMKVIVNAWFPDDVFGSNINPAYNPTGAAPVINSHDYYLHESYQIKQGAYDTEENWQSKTAALKNYQKTYGFYILAITTNNVSNSYDEAKFFYAWYSALIYGYTAVGWGEYQFSCMMPAKDSAPFRARPQVSFGLGPGFIGDVIKTGTRFVRETETGFYYVDTATHEYGYNPK